MFSHLNRLKRGERLSEKINHAPETAHIMQIEKVLGLIEVKKSPQDVI